MDFAFNNDKYVELQKEAILKRASAFHKLYLEVGGKLFDDYHASRVLPGFNPNNKINILLSLKEKSEVVIAINSNDIKNRKIRSDLGITYDVEVERLIRTFLELGLDVNSVVFSFYEPNVEVDKFIRKLKRMKIQTYKHYKIAGYPQDASLIVSDNGLGKNEYISTTKDIVIVTAPGPGSGKMATCLSQLYHDQKHGIISGYAKYETFPVWNLPLNHPVNIAYEAATIDLNDVNMIDPYHLEHYGKMAVNYNRDIDAFPLLRGILAGIYGESPYNSPTDMGVNMIGFAITNEEAAVRASKAEIIRRYYQALKNNYLGRFEDNTVGKEELLMNQLGVNKSDRKVVAACLKKQEQCGEHAVAIQLPNGKIITGKRSELFGAPAAALLNALKALAKIDDSIPLISKNVIEPIRNLKVNDLHNHNPRIHAEEILIALAIQAHTNPMAEIAIQQLKKLRGCQAHASCILQEAEAATFQKLGIDLTEEPVSYAKKYIHQK
mgnify:CR=1 FL=1